MQMHPRVEGAHRGDVARANDMRMQGSNERCDAVSKWVVH